MILADKIIMLRKRQGWSQEELASRLNVSRQSVSKWEMAQSVPDLNKIVLLSRLFQVTTDFLLLDEVEMPQNFVSSFSFNEASDFSGKPSDTNEDSNSQASLFKEILEPSPQDSSHKEVYSSSLQSFSSQEDQTRSAEDSCRREAFFDTQDTQADPQEDAQPSYNITLEQAVEYLTLSKKNAPLMAVAVFLCVISPICLLLLAGLSEYSFVSPLPFPFSGLSKLFSASHLPLNENTAAGLGLLIMILLITVAVGLFLLCGFRTKEYEFLEKEILHPEPAVTALASEQKKEFQSTYIILQIIGTLLCILSAVPLFLAVCLGHSVLTYIASICLLIFIVSLGCIAFVYGNTINSALQKLLEEGDYTPAQKKLRSSFGVISTIYWLIVTAIFLLYTYGPSGNLKAQYSWFIWAIAGVLYGAVVGIVKLLHKSH